MTVIRVRRLSGRSERVRVHKDPPRRTKLWQSKLLLLLPLFLYFKHLPLGILATSLGATSAVITIVFLAHTVRGFASVVARRATLLETAEHQSNKAIKLPNQVPIGPAMGAVKPGISSETA